ncbi:SPASM domain-containing protein [Paenibacillus pabuli]|uniref:SPASM domain-containing protein n=1 Tax=Paenibacillus pabuli TaxID=1472 RepID=UPI003CF968F5
MITFLSKPLLFKTESAHYCFDNSTRIVIPLQQKEQDFLQRIDCGSQVENSYFLHNNLKSLLAKIKKYNLFKTDFHMPYIDKAYIENKLETEGIAHLCLIVTDSCNLRCKYCIYSDHYLFTKGYSNKFMDSSTAFKAVYGQIFVSSEGQVYPCMMMRQFKLGDLRSELLWEIFFRKSHKPFWEMSKTQIEGCSDCPKNLSCFDCRALDSFKSEKLNGMYYCERLNTGVKTCELK